jgi:hypothetical protein
MTRDDRSTFCLSASTSTTHSTWDRAQVSTMTGGRLTALATTHDKMSGIMLLFFMLQRVVWMVTNPRWDRDLFLKCWRYRKWNYCRVANICLGSNGITFPSSSPVMLTLFSLIHVCYIFSYCYSSFSHFVLQLFGLNSLSLIKSPSCHLLFFSRT